MNKIISFAAVILVLVCGVDAGKIRTLSRSLDHPGADCACKLEENPNTSYRFVGSGTSSCESVSCPDKYVCVDKSATYCVFQQRKSKIVPVGDQTPLWCMRKEVSFKVLVKQE